MNSQGHSALFFACYGIANAETISILLNAGADPFQRDNEGRLPLHFAANSLDSQIIAALLKAPNMNSFKHDAANKAGQTPLHALFLPSSGILGTIQDRSTGIERCLPFFLERDNNPLDALHKKDNNGLSSLMLVKHFKLQGGFKQHVSEKLFQILLKGVSVPGNIAQLLNSDLYYRISPLEVVEIEINNMRPTCR